MFSLWAKERWDRDGFSFSSKRVSRCFLVDMGKTSIQSASLPVKDKYKISLSVKKTVYQSPDLKAIYQSKTKKESTDLKKQSPDQPIGYKTKSIGQAR